MALHNGIMAQGRAIPLKTNIIQFINNMKTGLLKKLRAEAHRAYCIKNRIQLPKAEVPKEWEGVYVIGLRNYTDKQDVVEFCLKDAKKRLHTLRNEYCIRRVQEFRESYRISRLNRL